MQSKTIKILKQSAFFLLFLFIFVLFIKATYPRFLDIHVLNSYVRQALDLPHGGCSSCHILHASPGAQLGMVDGNANLCMSCHNPVGAASQMPFTNADKAEPGVSGTSHAWNELAVNITYGADLPTNTEMALRIVDDMIICSTCHDQHSQDYPPFLRATNEGDALCKDCHSVRDVGIYSDNPAVNLGSHPVGVEYNGTDPRFETSPINPDILLIGSNVECSSCHQLHYAETSDGYLLRATNDDNLCQTCHTYGPHQSMGCSTCHQPHNTNRANIYMIRDNIETPNSGLLPAVFTAETGANSFADGDDVYDGICEVCHTATDFHRNNSSGNHNHAAGLNCTSCHTHQDAFAVNCTACHGFPPDGIAGPNLDGSHTAHFAPTAYGPQLSACEDCHLFSGATHDNGTVNFADDQLFATTTVCDNCHSTGGLFDGVNDINYGAKNNWINGVYADGNLMAGKENWCAGCHDSDPASSNQDGSGVAAPDVAGDGATYGYYYSGHGKNLMINCTNCHDPTVEHLDGEARTYAYDQSIANLEGTDYRNGYRLALVNGLEPMRIPVNDQVIIQFDPDNYRLCVNCHDWDNLTGNSAPFATSFNHSGANAGYSYGYGVGTEMNSHLANHLDMQTHSGVQPFWDSDWDFNTTADQVGSNPEVNGYDSYITCVTCHDIHGGQAFGGNTEGNMMRDGRLQGREPGLNFTYLVEATGGFPMVTSVGANKENSVGGVIRGGVDYRAGFDGTEADAICGGCHGERFPTTDEFNASGTAGNSCAECHMMSPSDNYFIDYFREPSPLSCTLCHGQPPDGNTSPNLAGSHETHISGTNGPGISDCSVCHADPENPTHLNTFTSFSSGVDINSNGNIELAETDICDNCHSPAGSYDGVNDPDIGAKTNWQNGVYTGSDLTAGKEKWCAGCHDESPGNSLFDGSGIEAPKVIGDESASYIYGTGYGFYKTGHGLPDTETYPASGGVTDGAGLTCGSCHDLSSNHIDHDERTYDDGNISTTDPSVYRIAYRLKLVGGLEPMLIPSPANSGNNSDRFRLCYSCHDSGPFINSADMNTNLVTDGVNRHAYHIGRHTLQYSADYDFLEYNSRITCVTCHNVHGSSNLTMVRNGELIDREPGLRIWYNNDDITTYVTWNTAPPDPENVSLAASTGTVWSGGSSSNLCTHCHGSPNTTPEYRFPFQEVNTAPWLEWVGDLDFETDGVNPDTSTANTPIIFRINYFDNNNDLPSISQLLVDTNGDGITDSVDMDVAPEDLNVTDGSAHYVITNIAKSVALGPGDMDYRFYFVSTDSVATGEPTVNHQFNIENNPPVLDWSANTNFETDGVHPNTGPVGDFNFEVLYTDADGDLPSTITLVIDDVEPGYDMTAGAGDIQTGRVYTSTQNLSVLKDYNYRFMARDNDIWGSNAVLETGPLTNQTFTVRSSSNNMPTLSYVSEDCFTNGLMPARGPVDGDYDFRVIYTDIDDEAPTSISVLIDNTDEYALTELSGDITTGRLYGATIQLSDVGSHTYHFSANDGQDPAIGDPSIVDGSLLEVVNALKVKPNDMRPGWYGNIQDAVDAFHDTLIMVYPGTYQEKLSLQYSSDDMITIEAVCGPENTIIDSTGTIIYFNSIPTYTKIIGFTITGGTTGAWFRAADTEITNCIIRNNLNRGIYSSHGSNITVTNTIIKDNNEFGANTNGDGGGIMFNGGTWPVISGCVISNNHSTGRGGGIFAQNITTGALTVTDSEISNNSCASTGGGIGANISNLVIINSKIISNTSSGAAGGFYVQGGGITLDVRSSIIADNTAVEAGGIWMNGLSNVSIANSLFIRNRTFDTVTARGGAIYTNINCFPVITNSIFWDNEAGRGDDVYAHQSTEVFTFNYCNLINNGDKLFSNGGTFLVNSTNIFSDPLFQDEANGDYRLMPISPCIDVGTITGAPLDDINGQARGADGRGDGNVTGDFSDYDIGPYEYVP